jgi:hypothetical protein
VSNPARFPPNYNSQGLDARVERTVQNSGAHSQIVEQALRRISDTDYSLGNYPFCIPVPAVIKNRTPGHQRMSLSSNMMRETADGRLSLSLIRPNMDSNHECIPGLLGGQHFFKGRKQGIGNREQGWYTHRHTSCVTDSICMASAGLTARGAVPGGCFIP